MAVLLPPVLAQFLFPTLNFREPYSEDHQDCLHMKFYVIIAFLSGYGGR